MIITRKRVLTGIKDLVSQDDIVFCIGKTLSKEASIFTEHTIFIDDNFVDFLSIITGLAMTTERRVLIIIEDQYMLKYFNTILQIAVSKCTNLFIITIVTSLYDVVIPQTNLFNTLRSIKGILFNSGILTHEYTKYFETKASVKQLKGIYDSTIGPVIGLVAISSNRLYNVGDNVSTFKDLSDLGEYIQTTPTANLFSKDKVSSLDDIMMDK